MDTSGSTTLAVPPLWLAGILVGTPVLVMLTAVASLRQVYARPLAVQRRARRGRPSLWLAVPLIVGLGGQFALLPFRDRLAVTGRGRWPAAARDARGAADPGHDRGLRPHRTVARRDGRSAAVARLSRRVPSLLAARRIAENPQATFYSVAAVGLAAIALAYIGCTVAVNAPPDRLGRAGRAVERVTAPRRGVGHDRRRAGSVGRAAAVRPAAPCGRTPVAPWPAPTWRGCSTSPARTLRTPGSSSRLAGCRPSGDSRTSLYIPTDGSLAAENRVRTEAANLVPNAIINSSRDPIDYNLETFFRDLDRLAAVAALFVLIIGAFGLAASMVGGLIERRRPFALLRATRRVPGRVAPGGVAGDRGDHGGGLGRRRRRRHAARVRLLPAGRRGLALAGAGRVRLHRRRCARRAALLHRSPCPCSTSPPATTPSASSSAPGAASAVDDLDQHHPGAPSGVRSGGVHGSRVHEDGVAGPAGQLAHRRP